jgi:cellulose synthase/poly-beta-1,6-N-acetylglucosamine synthase-like glycosyltransferase
MPVVLQIVFWGAVLMLLHSYIFYPLLLKMLAGASPLNPPKGDFADAQTGAGVTVLMSVFNEEKVIAQKLESIFTGNFPLEKLEVIIGSDCSDDATEKIIGTWQQKHSQIKLQRFNERTGKPQILNALVKQATNDFVIFTDANVIFSANTITNLLNCFGDEQVGLAGATILNEGMRKDGISYQEEKYIQGENKIKYREGILWGTMMGPFGGCFMMRKNLFEPIPANFIVDDFFLAMVTFEKNKKCICAAHAVCYEDVSNEMQQEFRRKARISAGNFQNLNRFKHFLLKPFSAVGFCFLSHKVLRWWGPFFIIAATLCAAVLAFYSTFYLLMLAGIALLLCAPLFDKLQKLLGLNNFLMRLASYFVWMNLALLIGYVNYKKGVRSNVWSRTERVTNPEGVKRK